MINYVWPCKMLYGNTKTEKLRNDFSVITICRAKLYA
jgi:hypothetical protein